MSRIVVGVDAGGSRTIAAAARGDEPPHNTFVGDAANPHVNGIDGAVDAIARAVTSVLQGDAPGAIVVGGAGAGRAETVDAMTEGLRARFPEARIGVTHDAHIALRGAIPAGDGIVLVAGTGSIAYGEIAGRQFRAGGGGFALRDEGSGYAIGSAGLHLLLRSFEDRVPRDPLLDALAAYTGATSARDLIAYVYDGRTPVATVAGVAAIVLELADSGERSANKIVQAAALELFELVRAVCRMAEASAIDLPLAFSGGLLKKNGVLTYLVETRIANDLPHLHVVKGGGAPHLGALAQARELLRNGSLP
jgi:N-acetylglucosamine kinase-like BadF-type ATPase